MVLTNPVILTKKVLLASDALSFKWQALSHLHWICSKQQLKALIFCLFVKFKTHISVKSKFKNLSKICKGLLLFDLQQKRNQGWDSTKIKIDILRIPFWDVKYNLKFVTLLRLWRRACAFVVTSTQNHWIIPF